MASIDDNPILSVLTKLRADWPNRSWSWDGRLPTVASSFDASLAAQARAATEVALPHCYNAESIAGAPAEMAELVARSGGLRGEQLAFYGGSSRSAYALWWPWGGGKTVSLRVGLFGAERDPALVAALRDLFGVSD
jgi:hypothetical protein